MVNRVSCLVFSVSGASPLALVYILVEFSLKKQVHDLTNPRALAGGKERDKYRWVLTQNERLGLKPR